MTARHLRSYIPCLFCYSKCVHRETGVVRAVKIVSQAHRDVHSEVQCLKLCQGHPNVVRLIDYFVDGAYAYIVLELLSGGELLERIRQHKSFSEAEASRIMRSVVSAVHFMHSQGVVHRDLKPEVRVVHLNHQSILYERREAD